MSSIRLPYLPFVCFCCALMCVLGAVSVVLSRSALRRAESSIRDAREVASLVSSYLLRGPLSSSPAPTPALPDGGAEVGASEDPLTNRVDYISARRPLPDGWRLFSDSRGWALYNDQHPAHWYHMGDLSPFGLIDDIGPHWFFAHGVLYVVEGIHHDSI